VITATSTITLARGVLRVCPGTASGSAAASKPRVPSVSAERGTTAPSRLPCRWARVTGALPTPLT